MPIHRVIAGADRTLPYLNLEKPKLEPVVRCDRLRTAGTIKIGTDLNFVTELTDIRRYRYLAPVG
jgi:hypothetical protein